VRKWDPVGAVWILTAGCLQTESPGAGWAARCAAP